jgi:DNA-binding response OmpR family regulator
MSKKQIIVIDDEPETVEMLKQFLELFEFDVTGAMTGTGGMQLAVSGKPDAIILDLMLPDADGYQICRLMRHHPNLANTPILILSARISREDEIKGLSYGATVYLRKPIDLNKLVEALRKSLETGHVAAAGIKQEPAPGDTGKLSGGTGSFLKGSVTGEPAPVEVQPGFKKKHQTVHIPGMYIPRDLQDPKDPNKTGDQ